MLTALAYLNDVRKAEEQAFLNLDIEIKAKKRRCFGIS